MESCPTINAVVLARRDVADGIAEVTLGRPDNAPLPPWEPGAHVDLILRPGLVRQYSLCGTPTATATYTVAIRREPDGRGGSMWAHSNLVPGALVDVRGPRNHFPLVRATGYVFVAGGIGITPMLRLIDAVADTGRPWRLVYTGRARSRMAYADEVAAKYPGLVEIHDSTTGRLETSSAIGVLEPGTAVYCCGPASLIEAVSNHCEPQYAVDAFTERFVPRDPGRPLWADAFDVEFAYSGKTLTVDPGKSILEVAESHGIVVLASCREGTCGTCETGVVSGEIDHRDSVLTPEECAEGESMMVCVSRAAGARLVLEL